MVGTGMSSDTCANLEDDSPLTLVDGNTADEPLSKRCDKFLISVTDLKLNDISLDANDIDKGDAWSNEPTVSAIGMENVGSIISTVTSKRERQGEYTYLICLGLNSYLIDICRDPKWILPFVE